MAAPQIVTTLTDKRDEIEAHIRKLRRQLAVAETDLASVTAVLALYDLPAGTTAHFPAYAHLNRLFAYGEMFGLRKVAIAKASMPITTREIALAVIRVKGWDEGDRMLRNAVAYRLIQTLTGAEMQGRIVDAGQRGNVRAWSLPTEANERRTDAERSVEYTIGSP